MSADPARPAGGGSGRAGQEGGTAAGSSAAASAVTALYQQHAVGLIRLAMIMLGDRAAAEDVVQDAFFGLYRNWFRLGDPANALVYTRSSVLNGCRNALRTQARRGRRDHSAWVGTAPDLEGGQSSAGPPSGRLAAAQSAESQVLLTGEGRRMIAAIRKLPDRQREAIVLRFYLVDPARLALPQSAEAREADERALRAVAPAAKLPARAPASTGRVRRHQAWLAPLAAAAVVVAVALGLVIVKIHPNARVVPPSAPISVPAGSVPRYFVEIDPAGEWPTSQSGLLIGDTYTGKTVATVAPPAGTTFQSVSAASDDRTFVLFVTPATRALTTQPDVLSIYSLATGRLLHSWSTRHGSRVLPYFGSNATGPVADWPVLTWVDGDRRIAFLGDPSPSAAGNSFTWTLRELDVTAKGNGLQADSHVVWTEQTPNSGRDKYGCDLNNPLAISPDGRSFVCASGTAEANGERLMKWLVYPTGVNSSGRLVYHTDSNMGSGSSGYSAGMSADDEVLWANQSGSTVIVLWWRYVGTQAGDVHFGVISDGRFSPLPTSLITSPALYSPTAIAW